MPLVARRLAACGIDSLRIDTDAFTHRYALSFAPSPEGGTAVLRQGRKSIRIDAARAIWFRKYAQPAAHQMADERQAAAAQHEAATMMDALYAALETVPALDPLPLILAGENKLLQLSAAAAAGLAVPRTLVSSNGPAIRSFFRSCGGRIVAKMQTTLTWGMDAADGFFYTTRVRREDIATLPAVMPHSMIFQELLDKAFEFRVIYVDGRLFCGKIPGSAFIQDIDWRRPGIAFSWETATVPAAVAAGIRRFMKRMKLRFGALDIVCAADGRYYFLEVNPIGEWGMLEKQLGLPIAAAIAATLARLGGYSNVTH